MDEEKGKVVDGAFQKGNDGSVEKQEAKPGEDPKIETAVLIVLAENGRIGISTEPPFEIMRQLKAHEVPAFLAQALEMARDLSLDARVDGMVRQSLLRAAMPSAPAPTPEPGKTETPDEAPGGKNDAIPEKPEPTPEPTDGIPLLGTEEPKLGADGADGKDLE